MGKKLSKEFLQDCKELGIDPEIAHEARKLPDDHSAKWEVTLRVIRIDEDTFHFVPVSKEGK